MALIDNLIKEGWLKTPEIIEAFKKVGRVDFLSAQILESKTWAGEPRDIKKLAELNQALPIGYNQTISQPLVVAFMLELLEPKKGEKILDIGFGSGWTTALLGEIIGLKGEVIAIELIPELKELGEKNIAKYNFIEKGIVKCICGDGSKGYEEEAPFDKILASATATKIPESWKKQLKVGGRIVMPINSSIWLFIKKSETEFEQKEYPGFVFVPLIN